MDMDEEGMRVLADLHGEGNPENEVARNEFREIKENVLAEVGVLPVLPSPELMRSGAELKLTFPFPPCDDDSASSEIAATKPCLLVTSSVSSSP